VAVDHWSLAGPPWVRSLAELILSRLVSVRTALSRVVYEAPDRRKHSGGLKGMSACASLLRIRRDGLLAPLRPADLRSRS